jgi:aminopeptidase 2
MKGSTAEERNTALRSLGRAKAAHLIHKTLDLCLNGEVKAQDIYMPLAGLRAHTEGIIARWAWMKDNWEALVKKLPPGLNMLSSVVQICAASFSTEEHLAEVEEFFNGKDTKVCVNVLEP